MMMADPYDPEQRELIRRQDANWRALPIILGVVFLFALGFLLLSDSTNPPGRSVSAESQVAQPQ
jgi:hypothetical protein